MRIDGPQITGSFNLNGDTIADLDIFATTSSLNNLTSSVATTGSNIFIGTQTISGSIIPAVNNTFDLGSLTHQFRDLYLSSASLYIDGTKVLSSTTQELQITTDAGQSFKILEAGSDTITLQSGDGNITLASSGGGDVILDPTNGIISLKGTITVQTGNKVVASDGNNIHFGDGIVISGSLLSTGTALVSGSSQIVFSGLTGVPSGLISGSSQLLNSSGIVSSSTQVAGFGFANTGSNNFVGTQTITGSLFISSDLVVQGSSSLQNITASAVNIGANIVNLNTATPAIRFAGLNMFDSGSIGGSGSFLYDSVEDEFIFVHRGDGTNITSSVVLMGPETYNNVGNEIYVTNNRILKGTGNDHVADSIISETGGGIGISGSLSITGSIVATGTSLISGSSQVDVMSTTNIARLATTGSNVFTGVLNGTSAVFSGGVTTKETESTKSIVINGRDSDNLARIDFFRSDTTTFIGRIQMDNGTNSNMSIRAQGSITLQTAGTTPRLTIDTNGAATFSSGIATKGYAASTSYAALFNGFVGIGTNTPSTNSNLTLSTAGIFNLELIQTGQGGSTWQISSTNDQFTSGGGKLIFTYANSSANSLLTLVQSTGNVGIGTTGPGQKLTIIDTNKTIPASVGNIHIGTSNAFGINIGGGLTLGGRGDESLTQQSFASVSGRKLNAGDGDYTGYLAFGVAHSSSEVQEKMRIVGISGNVGIGTNNPLYKLHVSGSSQVTSYFQTSGTFAPISWTGDNGVTKGGVIAHDGNISIGGLNASETGVNDNSSLTIKSGSGFVGINTNTTNVPLTISTPGSVVDGTFFSTLTINNTGTSTISRVRFDRGGVARWGLTLLDTDIFAISNLFENGSVGANDTTFTIRNNGNIGIQTNNPINRLHVRGIFGSPSTSGNSQNGIARFGQTTGNGILDIGFGDPFSWLQSRDASNYAINYNLSLQPNGGNVAIGTTSPNGRLTIKAEVSNTPSLVFKNELGGPSSAISNFVSAVQTFTVVGTNTYITSTGNLLRFETNRESSSVLFDEGLLRFLTGPTNSNPSVRMSINSAGIIATPFQPAFMAYGNGNTTIDYSGTYLIYPSVHVNRGGHYNASNGVFTAPVAGIYMFSWSSIGGNADDVYRFFLMINNVVFLGDYHLRIDTGASGTEYGTNGNRSVIINLSVNDTVRIQFRNDSGNTLYGANGTTDAYHNFMGYLIG